MGLFSSIAGLAGPAIGSFFGPAGTAIGSALGGALAGAGGSKQSGSQTQTTQQQLDPRLQALLYGDGSSGSTGLLQQVAAQAQQGKPAGQAAFGQGIDSYLGGWGLDNFMRSQQNAQRLQETQNGAPQVGNIPGIGVNLVSNPNVNAPAQNSLNLSGSYDRFINGDPGSNPYLTRALQAGTDLNRQAFNNLQQDATRNLQENVLPSIRSGAIAAGGFGGSRQGIAEGKALGDFSRAQQNAASQFGAQNTAAITGAQAGAYESGQNRALSALQDLSGRQYGVASQNSAQGLQALLANQNAFQNAETSNAGLRTQRDLANLQAQLGTTAQNDARNIAGTGLSSSLLGQALNYGTTTSNADWQRLLQGSGALGQFAGAGGSSTTSSPLYQNQGANLLGGAAAGLGLYNQFKNSGNGGINSSFYTNNAGTGLSANDLYSLFGSP
jgi:hypothetical protein